ncbi:transglutaminase family protein [Polymorphobacter sp. PAMC 29334]|uniref:transglutaminase-like domain-containing protein n=1 Tax=Polymorphobacter sp. PAMC 29334 TaxID=2862331 RepID=UPI001C770798|nr:transglutaminase family protein [Polymorphobacter sp. PAMC 29334]QYE33749.1 transglutaminase family protein [Polymorphobacter sp. PAMC 29334]
MLIRAGYELILGVNVPTAMTAMLKVHPSRAADLRTPQAVVTSPALPTRDYIDQFGNICTRMVLPPGDTVLSCDVVVEDSGMPDPQYLDAIQHPVDDVPDDALIYLLGSRYCETDRMSALAWSLFGHVEPGWGRVQAIVEYAHHRLEYGYEHADATRTANEGHEHRVGVCRDFAHLAIALCRCMNIPARYCTGYLGDIGVPPAATAMDFHAWFDVYLGGGWHVFDARHNHPRIGRILMAHGRDATDTALTTTFGPVWLNGFKVHTDEVYSVELTPA